MRLPRLLLAALATVGLAAVALAGEPGVYSVTIRLESLEDDDVAVPPPPVAAPKAAVKPAAPAKGPMLAAPDAKDAQDLVFFSERRPILVRLHVQLDGKPFSAAWDDFLRKLFDYYDLNNDGVLTKKETEHLLRGPSMVSVFSGQIDIYNFQANFARAEDLDTNKDGKITREEFTAYYRKFASGIRGQQSQQGGGQSGQLTTALFRHLDLNKDGKLSKEELAQAPVSLKKADLDDDETIAADELMPARSNYYEIVGGPNQNNALPDNSAVVLLVPGTPAAPLVQRLLSHYDKDHNRKLSREEASLDREAFDLLDANHDGQLDADELAKWAGRPADLELMVQLGQANPAAGKGSIFAPLAELSKALAKKPMLDVFNPSGRKMPLASALKKEGEGLVLTLPDSLVELQRGTGNNRNFGFNVKQFYIQQFDQIDTEKKGYLEKKQFENPNFQFLKPLFELADRDGDGKLYKKEVNAFLDLQAAGATALVNLRVTDQGRGLFELLDANGDGRLSVRELRTAWSRLAPWDHDGDGQLAETEVPRQFQLNIERGQLAYPFQFAVFAGYNRTNRAPSGPRGPLWFRKMDRNSDGDVSFREWLGTEEDFRRIDTDGDGLISAEEAERYDALMRKEAKKDTKDAKDAKEVKKATEARR